VQASRSQSLKQTLSADERARAERFYFQKDRERFIVSRGLLRVILGRYLDMEPSQLQICYTSHGKPALARESGWDVLRFNVSHCQGLALYAITRGREVGVDLERLRTDFTAEQIANRFFSPREVAALRALPPNVRQAAFFTYWTLKESYIKARGEGLMLPLNKFDVVLVPGEPPTLNTKGDPQEASRWSLRKLAAGPGYVAALAVEGHDWRIKCWQWPEGYSLQVKSKPKSS
jgi:4'-phosphopantetheinyl transferase